MTIDAQVAKFRRAVAELSAAVEKLDFELFLHHPGTGTVGELMADYDHHRQQIGAWQRGEEG